MTKESRQYFQWINELESKLKEQKDEIASLKNELRILSQTVPELLHLESEDDIYQFILSKVVDLNPEVYVIVSARQKDADLLGIKLHYGFSQKLQKIIDLLGLDPRKMGISPNEMTIDERQKFTRGKFSLLEEGFYELSARKISKTLCRTVERLLQIEKIYSMGFSLKDKPQGGITIMLQKGQKIQSVDLIENIIRQAAITLERLHVEQDLIQAKEKAEESDRLKSAFLANMSHEIRTPMNGIIGFSEMFMNPELSEDRRKYYANIVIDSSKQLLTLVNDILDISLIEAGKVALKQEEVNINDLIMNLYAIYNSQAKNKNIGLHTCKDLEDRNSIIITDKNRLRQILSNLLKNAFKFTSKGHIQYGYTITDSRLQFFVKDTGICIESDQMDHIFEEFRQENVETAHQYGGAGLGLSISKKLVELLGGKIWVKSQKNKGSVFYFSISYYPVNENIQESQSRQKTEHGKAFTILVAEDDEINYLYIEEIMSGKNIELIQAHNGKQTVETCKNNPHIDMVLMDIKMPVMNGYEATREIKKFRPDLPIIAQTAYVMTEDRKKALDAGCDEYLSKPINAHELETIIEQLR